MDTIKLLKPITTVSSGSSNSLETTHPAFGVSSIEKIKTPVGFGVFRCKQGEEEIVLLRVNKAKVIRKITGDYIQTEEDLIEIAFSKEQWGSLLSGDTSVPCTISCIDGVYTPRISKITMVDDKPSTPPSRDPDPY